jgi:hypothetical protein
VLQGVDFLQSSEKQERGCVGFEVFTAVVLKSIFFWDMTPCSALSGIRRSSDALHGVISQKKILFKKEAV